MKFPAEEYERNVIGTLPFAPDRVSAVMGYDIEKGEDICWRVVLAWDYPSPNATHLFDDCDVVWRTPNNGAVEIVDL